MVDSIKCLGEIEEDSDNETPLSKALIILSSSIIIAISVDLFSLNPNCSSYNILYFIKKVDNLL
jgi:hypothetical protein